LNRQRERSVDLALAGVLLAFIAAVLLCNAYDWDYFFSVNEVDRRAWLLDHRLPLWSYQFCAGVTRIGDSQAFGLSPLFLLVLLFGSFWGTKLIVLASALAGCTSPRGCSPVRGLGRWTALRARSSPSRCSSSPATTSGTSWSGVNCTSLFFGWILYYTLEASARPLSPGVRDRRAVIWQHFSGAFPLERLLVVPFFLAFGPTRLPSFSPSVSPRGPRAAGGDSATPGPSWSAACSRRATGAGVDADQSRPRFLLSPSEVNAPFQLLAYQLLPTLGPEWLLPIASPQQLDLHEYSAFSLLPLALVVLGTRALRSRREGAEGSATGGAPRPGLGALVALYASIAALLVLGDFSEYAPFPMLNALLFQNAVNSIARFGVGVTLSLAMACALLVRQLPAPSLGPGTCAALLGLAALNVATFAWMFDPSRAVKLASLPSTPVGEMSWLVKLPAPPAEFGHELEAPHGSQMYPAILAGQGVINCYNPLPRAPFGVVLPEHPGRLIDDRTGAPGQACVEQSSFTQNHVRIAQACPAFVCLNLSVLNERDPPRGFRLVPALERFCRDPARALEHAAPAP
jgi:hypothetical protein